MNTVEHRSFWMAVMRRCGIALLLLAPLPAHAFTFGIGIEGGANLTYLTEWHALPELGLILEQRFDTRPVDLTIWEDLNLAVIYDGGWTFLPVDLGLRVGLPGSMFQPYIGALINDSLGGGGIATPGCACGASEKDFIPGIGGDIGFDLAVAFLRIGLELRAWETLIPPLTGPAYGNAFAAQALLSIRGEI